METTRMKENTGSSMDTAIESAGKARRMVINLDLLL